MKTYQNSLIVTRGFSLVELLVAMVIALVVMTGVVNSFLASKDAYRYNQELAFIQENARFADSKMGSDIRQAGNFGCNLEAPTPQKNIYYTNNLVNVLGNTSTMTTIDFYKAIGIQGYNHTTGWPNTTVSDAYTVVTAADADASPDAIMVRHADLDSAMPVQSHDAAPGYTFTLKTGTVNQTYKSGAIMVYADPACQYQAIFQSTGPAPSATTTTIAHNSGVGTPGNYSKLLQGMLHAGGSTYYFGNYAHSSECTTATTCSWGSSTPVYAADSKIMPMSSNIYYVNKSGIDPSINALWVIGLSDVGTTGTPQELVLGVDDMRIYYGVDTLDSANASTGTPDGTANRYVVADQITADTAVSGNTTFLDWNRVSSVRIQLLMRSRSKLSSNPSQTFQWEGDASSFTKNDGYLRQMVSFTIQLRNPFRG
jgi:type IV pilus assembly protein PilW